LKLKRHSSLTARSTAAVRARQRRRIRPGSLAAFSAIRGRGLRRTVGSQASLTKERHYLRIESVDSLGVVEPPHRHARDPKTADPRELVGNLLGRSDQWQRTPAGDEGTCLLRDDLRRQAPRPAADDVVNQPLGGLEVTA